MKTYILKTDHIQHKIQARTDDEAIQKGFELLKEMALSYFALYKKTNKLNYICIIENNNDRIVVC